MGRDITKLGDGVDGLVPPQGNKDRWSNPSFAYKPAEISPSPSESLCSSLLKAPVLCLPEPGQHSCEVSVKFLSAPASLGTLAAAQQWHSPGRELPELQSRCSWARGAQPELPSAASRGDLRSCEREAEQLPGTCQSGEGGEWFLSVANDFSRDRSRGVLRSAVLPGSLY